MSRTTRSQQKKELFTGFKTPSDLKWEHAYAEAQKKKKQKKEEKMRKNRGVQEKEETAIKTLFLLKQLQTSHKEKEKAETSLIKAVEEVIQSESRVRLFAKEGSQRLVEFVNYLEQNADLNILEITISETALDKMSLNELFLEIRFCCNSIMALNFKDYTGPKVELLLFQLVHIIFLVQIFLQTEDHRCEQVIGRLDEVLITLVEGLDKLSFVPKPIIGMIKKFFKEYKERDEEGRYTIVDYKHITEIIQSTFLKEEKEGEI